MIKRAVYAILLAELLCAFANAQEVEVFQGTPFIYTQSRRETDGWKLSLIPSRLRGLERQATSCVSARAMVLELVAWSHSIQPFLGTSVGQLSESRVSFFVSGMTIDADGAPDAYHPDDIGVDELANAGKPGHWNGIITDRNGNPAIQQENDPFPGYYISCTSLSDETKKFNDPTGYVDASKIPYIALPKELADRQGIRLGDFAFVVNLRNGKSSYAIYADVGTLGEGSIALADALGIPSDARRGGESDGILYLLFPASGNQRPRTITEIKSEGGRAFFSLKGMKRLSVLSCTKRELQPIGKRSSALGTEN